MSFSINGVIFIIVMAVLVTNGRHYPMYVYTLAAVKTFARGMFF